MDPRGRVPGAHDQPDNLPACRPGLPDRAADVPHGPTGVPLSRTPDEVLCFALGFVTARPVHADQYGGVTALVEELMRRDHAVRYMGIDTSEGSLWNVVLAGVPPELARNLQLLYMAHRGRRWTATGQRHGSQNG